MFDCPNLAVPMSIMQHVVNVESSRNPYAIGVVGGSLVRQPADLSEAVATANMLEQKGKNFSLGISQVNRYNLAKYGIGSYAEAFEPCNNLRAGSMILRECYDRAADWGKAFSCYYSGNFVTGYRHGYVQKIFASINRGQAPVAQPRIARANPVSTVRVASRNQPAVGYNSSRPALNVVSNPTYLTPSRTRLRSSQPIARVSRISPADEVAQPVATVALAARKEVSDDRPETKYMDDPVPVGKAQLNSAQVSAQNQADELVGQSKPKSKADQAFVF